MSVTQQEILRKYVRGRGDCVTVSCSSLDPMIIQSCWRQREAVDDYVNIRGSRNAASIQLQTLSNNNHNNYNNNNLQTIYRFSHSSDTLLKCVLPFKPSSLSYIRFLLRWSFYLHPASSLPCLYTVQW